MYSKIEVKEHPIIFSTDMVKAILDERKTQTRRIMKPQPELIPDDVPTYYGEKYWWSSREFRSMVRLPDDIGCMPSQCPYGQVGDRLWVRETFAINFKGQIMTKAQKEYLADMLDITEQVNKINIKWTSPYFMKKENAPHWLEITEVRVERVQEITEQDVLAEGIPSFTLAKGVLASKPPDPRWAFIELWDSLNAKRGYGWEVNPWVWVISFNLVNISTTNV